MLSHTILTFASKSKNRPAAAQDSDLETDVILIVDISDPLSDLAMLFPLLEVPGRPKNAPNAAS
jgi:hypothetical protein